MEFHFPMACKISVFNSPSQLVHVFLCPNPLLPHRHLTDHLTDIGFKYFYYFRQPVQSTMNLAYWTCAWRLWCILYTGRGSATLRNSCQSGWSFDSQGCSFGAMYTCTCIYMHASSTSQQLLIAMHDIVNTRASLNQEMQVLEQEILLMCPITNLC